MVEVETQSTEDADGDGNPDTVIKKEEKRETKTKKDSYSVKFDPEQ